MKNYKELDLEYRDLIEKYERNGDWVEEIQDAILELVKDKEIVVSTLINEMLECKKAETVAKMKLLRLNFTEEEIRSLAYQYYETVQR